MRHILILALFFTCLSAASAAADPLTNLNNDASLRKTRWWMPDLLPKFQRAQPIRLQSRPVVEPTPEDSDRRGN
jgi:hypothetical protein